ncbi:MAG: adenylosuccinate lyase [Peptococcaceae bacterium]|nr:adenylosuccinate lyase [Peptococcaceae bacterium]
MIERYTKPEMAAIWSQENKLKVMMEVEILACEGMAAIGQIPEEAAKNIREKASFTVERVNEIEKTTRHDVIAFVSCLAENIGEDGKYVHAGMTSSDILDTGLAVQMKQAGEANLKLLKEFAEVIKEKAIQYKDTLCIGRTHGVHAEPITFGLKLAVWYEETLRNIERLEHAIENISAGQISGAVGTFANIDPRIEEYVCEHLGLKPEPVSTQVIARDRHTEYMMTLAIIATSLDKFMTEIRNLQRTEIFEVMEEFKKGQKGSSAMPHKRNPMTCERICGLARVIRGNVIPTLENSVLWHERDLAHSSVERVIIPDSTTLLYYILTLAINVVKNLEVHEDQMMANVEKTLGLVFSQRLMLTIVGKGHQRDDVYPLVQAHALHAWDTKTSFKELVRQDENIMQYITEEELDNIFDYSYHTKNVDYIFKRCGLI